MLRSVFYVPVLAFGIITLTACQQHDNPLKNAGEYQASKFLVDASVYAEKKLSLPHKLHTYAYRECMDKKLEGPTCQPLFKYMVEFSRSSHQFPILKDITVSDLTDQKIWNWIRNDYDTRAFNYID